MNPPIPQGMWNLIRMYLALRQAGRIVLHVERGGAVRGVAFHTGPAKNGGPARASPGERAGPVKPAN